MNDRLAETLARIDALNREDPSADVGDDRSGARELIYSRRLSDWVTRLAPEASEALRIAARGQHVQRWKIQRDRYPMTRAGYLKWRETLKQFHAETVGAVMREAGYDAAAVAHVRNIILKKNLKTDPEAQTIEDALCLVFLETQFADLRMKTPEDKMIDVVRKTWAKMSPRAQRLALELPLPADDRDFLKRALSTPSAG